MVIIYKIKGKQKAINKDRCYNCYKFGHFRKDCRNTDYQTFKHFEYKKSRPTKLAKQYNQNTSNWANIINIDNDSNPELFQPGIPNMVKK